MNDLDPLFKEACWEDIKISTLNFNNKTEQIVFIALSKEQAEKAYTTHVFPNNLRAYEYMENITLNKNQVIMALYINTSDIFDLTDKNDYENALVSKITHKIVSERKPKIIRDIEINTSTHQFMVIFKIIDFSVIKQKFKVQ